MNLYLAGDHASFEVKQRLVDWLKGLGHNVQDLGTNSNESCDYADYASKLVSELLKDQSNKKFGILICGNGIGISMAANRYKNIRAGRCVSVNDAYLTRLHNNANVLCLGARISSETELKAMIEKFITTEFEGGRHQRRVDLFDNLGEFRPSL